MNTNERLDGPLNSLDRILLDQETLMPSSGFASSVIDAIQQEAAAPAPIPFPWKWALPGMAALVVSIVILCRFAFAAVKNMNQSQTIDWLTWLRSNAESAVLLRTQVAPILLALVASFVSVALGRKLVGGRSTR